VWVSHPAIVATSPTSQRRRRVRSNIDERDGFRSQCRLSRCPFTGLCGGWLGGSGDRGEPGVAFECPGDGVEGGQAVGERVWCWPGNTADSGLIRQVKKDLREWVLSKVIRVADRGFSSEKNRRALMQGGGGYIIGEKLRSGSPEVRAALSRQGRYKIVRDNLQVKEVNMGDDGDRFIICHNPDQAGRDAAIRARLVAQLEELIDGSGALTAAERGKIEGSLAGRPGLKRFLRVTPSGLLRIDKARIKAEENLDGKYLLRTSDPHLTTEDIALGYKQLLEVERGWRDMKQVIDLRPVYHHRKEDRIRAHVILCWLALLLMRVAENTAERPWARIRAELQRQHAVTWTGPAGSFRQTTDLTKPLRDLYTALSIEPPKKILALDPAPATH